MPRSQIGSGCVASNGSSPGASRHEIAQNPAESGEFASARRDVRPVIGLTTYLQRAQTGVWDVRASFLPAIYFEGVGQAGGISVLLPPQPVDAGVAERVLDGIDGSGHHRRARRRPRRLRQSACTLPPTSPSPTAGRVTPSSSRCCRARCDGACRCWVSAGARRCSTSRSGARCTSIFPTSSATPATSRATRCSARRRSRRCPAPGSQALVGPTTEAQCYHHQAIDRARGRPDRERLRRRRGDRGGRARSGATPAQLGGGGAVASRGTARRPSAVRGTGRRRSEAMRLRRPGK